MIALRFERLEFVSKEDVQKVIPLVKTGSVISDNLQSIFLNVVCISSIHLGAVEEKAENKFDISTIITYWI